MLCFLVLVLEELHTVQCPHSEEEHSVATICGFGEEFNDMRVKTCGRGRSELAPTLFIFFLASKAKNLEIFVILLLAAWLQ